MSLDMNMKILVVDDSGTMRMMFKQMLIKVGFQNLVFAVDGKDATDKLAEHQVDFIISDWNMPVRDGLEFLKIVRSDESFKNIPFLMATAQGDKTQQELVINEGGNGHISKPFSENELKEKIEEIFGLKKDLPEEIAERRSVGGKIRMRIGHIQITDHLALGVLKHRINANEVTPKYFELETVQMPGWNPVQDALEKGTIDGAFILAPIAMDLFGFNVPIKLVLLAHKNGSIFVRNSRYNVEDYTSLADYYKYKVVDIPHKMSVHNMLAHQYLSELGLKPGVPGKKAINVRFEVVPPIQMPNILKNNEDVGGFIVAEPIGSNAISKGIAEQQFLSSELWNSHPCCVAAVRDDFISAHEDAVYEFTSMLVDTGKYIEKNKNVAAEIAVSFLDPDRSLGLTNEVIHRVLDAPKGITMHDLYPVLEDLDAIQRYMHERMDIGVLIDLEKFVDFRFADAAIKTSY